MEKEISIVDIWELVVKYYKLILCIALVFLLVTFITTYFIFTPKYTSEALMHIDSREEPSANIGVNDLIAAQRLVNTCTVLFKDTVVLNKLITDLSLNYTIKDLEKMITITAVLNTEILKISVQSADNVEAAAIANYLTVAGPAEFDRIVSSGNVQMISPATISTIPSSPNYVLNFLVCLALIIMFSMLLIFTLEKMNTTLEKNDDLNSIYDIPVLSNIMEIDVRTKGKY